MRNRFSLDRLPLETDPSAYRDVSERLVEILSSVEGFRAVYSTGGVSTPGISDLDLVLVTESAARIPGVWSRLSDRDRYIAMHTPFITSAETFSEHRWYASLVPLVLEAGTEVTVSPPSAETQTPLDRLLGLEGLLILRLKLERQAVTGRIKARPFLCELHALKYSLTLTGLDRSSAPRAWDVQEMTEGLRSTWFGIGEKERSIAIRELHYTAVEAVDGVLAHLALDLEMCIEPRVSLHAPWENVLLTSPGSLRRHRRWEYLIPRWGTLGELLWRSVSREVPVPPGVIGQIGRARASDGMFQERRTRYARYLAFARAQGEGWSRLGLAGVFSP